MVFLELVSQKYSYQQEGLEQVLWAYRSRHQTARGWAVPGDERLLS